LALLRPAFDPQKPTAELWGSRGRSDPGGGDIDFLIIVSRDRLDGRKFPGFADAATTYVSAGPAAATTSTSSEIVSRAQLIICPLFFLSTSASKENCH
jgi:hypothetical protein